MENKFNNKLIQNFKYTKHNNAFHNSIYYLLEAKDINNILYQTKILEPNWTKQNI